MFCNISCINHHNSDPSINISLRSKIWGFRLTGTGSSKKIGDLGEYRPIIDVREAEGELSPYDRAYSSIPPTSGKNFQA